MGELKACPFCDWEAKKFMGYDLHKVGCSNVHCEIYGHAFTVEAWNNRAPQSDWVSDTDKIIHGMFSSNWSGDLSKPPIEDMRKELYKNLKDQINGYWSGHTAYRIMTRGGFLVDSNRIPVDGGNKCKPKELTVLGKMFMKSMEDNAPTPPKGE